MPKSRLAGFPAALFAAGLGLTMYFGYGWWQLPSYSDAEIEQSVELNLAMDMQHRGPTLARDAATVDRLRQQVGDEVRGDIRRERQEQLRGFAAGLIALVLSLGQLVYLQLSARRP